VPIDRKLATTALALATALIAACGGSDDPGPPPDPAATAAYVARVDPLCKSYRHRLQVSSQDFEAVQHRAGAAGQMRAVAGRYRAAAALKDRLADEVAAIDPAPADAGAVKAWLVAVRSQAAAQRALADGLTAPGAAGDDAVSAAQAQLREEVEAGHSAIAGLGFTYCE